ncbi:MAG: hypothetical protein ACYS1A_20435, partial [Planctomycetota bacterium]
MAFALIINANTVSKKGPGHLNIGDIGPIREDWQYPPTSTEQVMFDVQWFRGYTVEQLRKKLPRADKVNAYKIKGKWYTHHQHDKDPDLQEEKEVWKDTDG